MQLFMILPDAPSRSYFSACSGIHRSDLPDQNLAGHTINQLDVVDNFVLYYASLAPSGHNSQPWYVRVLSQKEWIIGAGPDRRLPAVDPGNREVMLSIGAFAENLSTAAGTFGLKAEMDVIASDPFEQDVIKVRLKKAKPVDYPLQRITRRMTVKHEQRVIPHFVLRIGYLNTYPNPVSLRRPVSWFVRL